MERRFFFAILLSFVVLYAYQALFVPPSPPNRTTSGNTSSPVPAAEQASPPEAPPSQEAAAAPTVEAPVAGDEREREIVVETSTIQAVLTNQGGRVLHWRLKGYRDQSGNLVDLVPTDVPADQPRPFSLAVGDSALDKRINDALYRVSRRPGRSRRCNDPECTGRVRIRGRRRSSRA